MSQIYYMQDKHYIIGIAGGSGSGKTTFVNKIRDKFSLSEVCILSLDNYYIPRDQQKTDEQGVKNFDLPQSIDEKALFSDLDTIKSGNSITKTEYLFNNEKAKASTITIAPAPIIIIEGLFIYHYDLLKDVFDLKLYIHAKENLKLIRRIKRDKECRNYPVEDVIYRYEHHVMPSYEKYIKAYKEDADIVINNNKSLESGLNVIEAYIKSRVDKLSS